MSDRIFAVVWLAVCALIAVQMQQLEIPFSYEPVGPKAFPSLLAGLMALCCIYLLVKPDTDIQWPDASGIRKGLVLIAVLFGYAILFEQLGFPLATALMVVVVSRLFGGSWLNGLITGVLTGVLGYLFFDRLLQVTLPIGQLWR
ncbi:MAG: tripartite tricarboxylate transporter TctB family protein [Phycisphaerales bacterium]|nr:tripartite tricarboxylate transporter TctB family protein [Phycisphaerales bacterium]